MRSNETVAGQGDHFSDVDRTQMPCAPVRHRIVAELAGRVFDFGQLNRSEFDAASFCEKDAVYVEALPDRAA